MSLNHSSKGHGELQFVIFLSLFMVMMTIIGVLFRAETIKATPNSDTGLLNSISIFLSDIPIVGTFWSFIITTIQFSFVNGNLALIYGALVGIPVGYLIIRLVRGGG